MNVSIAPFVPRDEEHFNAYVARAFHAKYILRDPRYRAWQYGGTLLLARDGKGAIAGHFGFRDIAYKMREKSAAMRVLMNLFVVPEYRLSGVGALLSKAVFETRVPLLVASYTPLAERLFAHVRPRTWQNAGNLTRCLFVLNERAPLIARYGVPPSGARAEEPRAAGCAVREAGPDSAFDRLWARVRETFGVTVERTSSYLAWRFFEHPFFRYTVLEVQSGNDCLGYVVYRFEGDQGFKIARIIDFVSVPEAAPSLLAAVIQRAAQSGADAIDYLASGELASFQPFLLAGFFDTRGTPFEEFPIRFSPLSTRKNFINIGYDFNAPLEECFFTKADGDQDRPNPY